MHQKDGQRCPIEIEFTEANLMVNVKMDAAAWDKVIIRAKSQTQKKL